LRVVEQIEKVVNQLQSEENQGTKRYNVPQIMVVCPDTYNVVDLNKLLVEKYKDISGSKPEQDKT